MKPEKLKYSSAEKILSCKIITDAGCWEWTGPVNGRYGLFGLGGKTVYIHRYSYSHYKGAIPKDKEICHKCNNPICFNPEHLYAGTHLQNMRDLFIERKNRIGFVKPKLKEEQVVNIRALLDGGKANPIELSKTYNVSPEAIYSIAKRKRWKHI